MMSFDLGALKYIRSECRIILARDNFHWSLHVSCNSPPPFGPRPFLSPPSRTHRSQQRVAKQVCAVLTRRHVLRRGVAVQAGAKTGSRHVAVATG